jgi:hypothetical protein
MLPNCIFRTTRVAFSWICLFAATPASAVIVAGTSGTNLNNDTQAELDTYLSTTAYAPFPYWDNLVRVSNASGVYLGYNPSTSRGWVLSAAHINPTATTINVAGNAYTVTGSGTQIGTSDLKLFEIGGGISDPALPVLPTVLLASMAASVDEFLLMTGRGFTGSSTSPYPWIDPGENDANGMRWGTNTVEGTALINFGTVEDPDIHPYIYMDFDDDGDPGATAYDGQGALGDSGGGIFIYRAGQWELSGIAHFIDDGPDFLESAPETGNGITENSLEHGDFTAYSDVYAKVGTINGLTGTLIPEPSVISLLGLAALALLRRSR